jgi:hypothetical protein
MSISNNAMPLECLVKKNDYVLPSDIYLLDWDRRQIEVSQPNWAAPEERRDPSRP